MTTQFKPDPVDCTVTIVMDENGEWRLCVTDDDNINDAVSSLSEDGGNQVRRYDLTIRMTPPRARLATITVPDDESAEPSLELITGG